MGNNEYNRNVSPGGSNLPFPAPRQTSTGQAAPTRAESWSTLCPLTGVQAEAPRGTAGQTGTAP